MCGSDADTVKRVFLPSRVPLLYCSLSHCGSEWTARLDLEDHLREEEERNSSQVKGRRHRFLTHRLQLQSDLLDLIPAVLVLENKVNPTNHTQ